MGHGDGVSVVPTVAKTTRSSGRGTSRGKSRASATKKKTTSKPKNQGPGRVSTAVETAFDGRQADVWGVVLIALGLLAGLGLYLDLAGPVGEGFRVAFGTILGLARVVVPPALVALGAGLIFGRGSSSESSQPSASDRLARFGIGAVLLFIAVAGALHLSRSKPSWGDEVDDFIEAGGVVGYAIGAPLELLLSIWGASLALITIGTIGVLIITGISLLDAGRLIKRAVLAIGRSLAKALNIAMGDERRTTDRDDLPPEQPVISINGKPAALFDQDETVLDLTAAEKPTHELPAEEETPVPVAKDKGTKKVKVQVPEPTSTEQLEIELGPAAKGSPWKLPSAKMLNRSKDQNINQAAVEERGRVLERALAAHGVETRLVGMVVGPTVTRYELELGPGVKVSRVTSLNKDIAYAMASPDVRILAPIPGRQAIGVEVPNTDRAVVALGDILGSPEARRSTGALEVAVGRDINGKSVMMDLAKMPHILIAGATGAGKSSCINSIVTSVLMRTTPDQVRMILIDPKMVEMSQYERVPHLLTQPVIDPKKAANALQWACREMDRRYELLSEVGYRDIGGYNAAYDKGTIEAPPGAIDAEGDPKTYPRLPLILVVVDELADLMMVAARDVEDSICRIAQKARAVGIHLVIATQRPSTNVITGVIKANVPARLAFAVSSLTDSRVILDQPGAERLVGQGDMLLLDPKSSSANRIQGAWVTEEEVKSIVAAWRKQAKDLETEDEPSITAASITDVQQPASAEGLPGGTTGDEEEDELLLKAMELVVESQLGSTSMLQRKLRVGFARAGRLMDLLEERGVVGPSEGSKARDVMMSPEDLESARAGV